MSEPILGVDRVFADEFRADSNSLWGGGLDYLGLLRMQAVWLLRDTARAHAGQPDRRLDAVVQVVGSAVLFSAEIELLLRNGFVPGATARWRSLHEAVVLAKVFSERAKKLSIRYLDQQIVELANAAEAGHLFGPKKSMRAEERAALRSLRESRSAALEKHGPALKNPYGWAEPLVRKPRPSMEDIERAVHARHRRPRYRVANKHIHASPSGDWFIQTIPSSVGLRSIGPRHDGTFDVAISSSALVAEAISHLLWARSDRTRNAELTAWNNLGWLLAGEAQRQLIRAEQTRLIRLGRIDDAQRLTEDPGRAWPMDPTILWPE